MAEHGAGSQSLEEIHSYDDVRPSEIDLDRGIAAAEPVSAETRETGNNRGVIRDKSTIGKTTEAAGTSPEAADTAEDSHPGFLARASAARKCLIKDVKDASNVLKSQMQKLHHKPPRDFLQEEVDENSIEGVVKTWLITDASKRKLVCWLEAQGWLVAARPDASFGEVTDDDLLSAKIKRRKERANILLHINNLDPLALAVVVSDKERRKGMSTFSQAQMVVSGLILTAFIVAVFPGYVLPDDKSEIYTGQESRPLVTTPAAVRTFRFLCVVAGAASLVNILADFLLITFLNVDLVFNNTLVELQPLSLMLQVQMFSFWAEILVAFGAVFTASTCFLSSGLGIAAIVLIALGFLAFLLLLPHVSRKNLTKLLRRGGCCMPTCICSTKAYA